jgi:HlyD family secretion protein
MAFQTPSRYRQRAGIALSAGLVAIFTSGTAGGSDRGVPRYATAAVQRGDIRAVVRAAGSTRPITTVPVNPAIAGSVKQVFGHLHARVQAGQILAQLDPAPHEEQMARARGRLAQAERELRHLQASLPTMEVEVEASQSNLNRLQAVAESSRTEAARVANLFQQGILPQDQHDQSQAGLQQAEAQVREAEAKWQASQKRLEKALAQVEEAQSRVDAERAALQQAEANLRSTAILSPIDGVVVARAISPGQAVDVSPEVTPLFLIAPDLRRMHVRVRTDRADSEQVRVGMEARIHFDDLPTEVLRGSVTAMQPGADAIIEFENPGERLLPDTVAYVTIPIGQALNVLRIPNAALRFRPRMNPGELQTLYEKHKIPGLAAGDQPGDWQVVWRLNARRRPEPVAVRLGWTDHSFTELLEGSLSEGDALITGQWTARRSLPSAGVAPAPQGAGSLQR